MPQQLTQIYAGYISCLNAQNWSVLGQFVHDSVVHNGRRLGLAGYCDMLKEDFSNIPDLFFNVELLVSEPPNIACRLQFDCAPTHRFLGLPVNGRRIRFAENVFYEFAHNRIVEVWSVIDKASIEAQLAGAPIGGRVDS